MSQGKITHTLKGEKGHGYIPGLRYLLHLKGDITQGYVLGKDNSYNTQVQI